MRRKMTLQAGFAFLVTLCAGCGGEFTRANFDAIRLRVDTRETVESKLGKPNSDMGGDDTWYYEHADRHDGAVIQFDEKSGTVLNKRWLESVAGEGGVKTPTIWKELGVE